MCNCYLRCDPILYHTTVVNSRHLETTGMTRTNYDSIYRTMCKDKIEGVGLSAAETAQWQPR